MAQRNARSPQSNEFLRNMKTHRGCRSRLQRNLFKSGDFGEESRTMLYIMLIWFQTKLSLRMKVLLLFIPLSTKVALHLLAPCNLTHV